MPVNADTASKNCYKVHLVRKCSVFSFCILRYCYNFRAFALPRFIAWSRKHVSTWSAHRIASVREIKFLKFVMISGGTWSMVTGHSAWQIKQRTVCSKEDNFLFSQNKRLANRLRGWRRRQKFEPPLNSQKLIRPFEQVIWWSWHWILQI